MSLPSVHFIFAASANQLSAVLQSGRTLAANFAKAIWMPGREEETQNFAKQLHQGKKTFSSFGTAYRTNRRVTPVAITAPKMITVQLVAAENVRLLLRCRERMVAAYATALGIAIVISGRSQPAWRFLHDH